MFLLSNGKAKPIWNNILQRHTLPQLYLYWSSVVNKRQWFKPSKKSANNDRTLINIF